MRGHWCHIQCSFFLSESEFMRKLLKLEDMVFGHLHVIEQADDYVDPAGRARFRWHCRCDCGNYVDVLQENLTSGNSKSCGKCLYQNVWVEHDDYMIGYTVNGVSFLIDKEDWPRVRQSYWHPEHQGYFVTVREQKRILLHRLITGVEDGMIVDHINHDPSDNRKCNLRCVNRSQNGRNKKLRSDSTSGCAGVCYRKDNGKWRVSITVNGRRKNLGQYDSFEEAVAVRKAAEEQYFGQYSYDNSIAAVPRIAV